MNNNLKKLILAALFAALSCVATMSIRIPTPGTGGYIHPGDAIVILSGVILGPVWGFLAGGIGSALSDLIGGYFIYVPITFVIKGLVALAAGLLYQKIGKTRRAATLQSFLAVLQTSSSLQADISYVNPSSTEQAQLPASLQTSFRVPADLLFPVSFTRS